MVERFHRQMKAAVMSHATTRWSEVLPTVLLGIRAALKEDIKTSSAELVFGAPLRLPGEFLRPERTKLQHSQFLQLLRQRMDSLRPTPASHHAHGKLHHSNAYSAKSSSFAFQPITELTPTLEVEIENRNCAWVFLAKKLHLLTIQWA
ncbi:hypothetical protein JTE90_005816 [Oedothorax gibbosus]|uniref:Integrase catalytic domain-containing protein n=1 Tax=Oedothorax gibbosus TaxID=931172 RepID=A0AAV6V245_9ARAC|nr:hypothetical protein JTE90_005816 [Oedothorax gibbosus]